MHRLELALEHLYSNKNIQEDELARSTAPTDLITSAVFREKPSWTRELTGRPSPAPVVILRQQWVDWAAPIHRRVSLNELRIKRRVPLLRVDRLHGPPALRCVFAIFNLPCQLHPCSHNHTHRYCRSNDSQHLQRQTLPPPLSSTGRERKKKAGGEKK